MADPVRRPEVEPEQPGGAGQPQEGAEPQPGGAEPQQDRQRRSARLLGADPAPAESWDERPESDDQVLDRYLADRPPHHGG